MTELEFNKLLETLNNKAFLECTLTISAPTLDGERIENGLNDNQAILLANALKKNPHITELDLSCNNIREEGAIALAGVTTLKELILYENPISIKGATVLAKSNLQKLSLAATCIESNQNNTDQMIEMIDAFINNKTIVDLDLSHCYIFDEIVAKLIKHNTTIKYLSLSKFLEDKALEAIGNNTTLERLYLPENQLTDKGAEYISQNISLRELRIEQSQITDKGAQFLSKHSTLKKLYMHDSDITKAGVRFFIGSELNEVIFNSNLKHLLTEQEYYRFCFAFSEAKTFKKGLEYEIDKKECEENSYVDFKITNVNLSGDIDTDNLD